MKKKIFIGCLVAILATVGYLATLSDEPIDESQKFVNIESYIQKSEMIADIDTLFATFERIHPNPYRFESKTQRVAKLELLKKDLADSLKIIDFWRVIDQIANDYNDAHSYAHDQYVLTDHVKKGGVFFPLPVKISDGKLIVSESKSQEQVIPTGAEILKINQLGAKEIITELQKHASKETEELDLLQISDDFGFYLWKAFDWQKDFELRYSNPKDSALLDSLTVEGITWEERSLSKPEESESYKFEFLAEDVGYLKIADFNGSETEINDFYEESFRKMKEKGSKNLIIDIRGHSGGADSYGENLVKYFAPKPFRKLAKAYWKITPEFKNAFDRKFVPKGIRWFKPIYLVNEYSSVFYGADLNETVTVEYELKKPLPAEEQFQGEVFLITDHKTFSAGSILAEMFSHYEMGTVVGQPTGNLQSFNGFALTESILPNSKLTFQVSSVYNLANSGEEGYRSVEPDILLNDSINPVSYVLESLVEQGK